MKYEDKSIMKINWTHLMEKEGRKMRWVVNKTRGNQNKSESLWERNIFRFSNDVFLTYWNWIYWNQILPLRVETIGCRLNPWCMKYSAGTLRCLVKKYENNVGYFTNVGRNSYVSSSSPFIMKNVNSIWKEEAKYQPS